MTDGRDGVQVVKRVTRSTSPIGGVFYANQASVRVVASRAFGFPNGCPDMLRSHSTPVTVNKRDRASRQRGKATALVEVDVCFTFQHNFIAGARMCSDRYGVGHGSRGQEQTRFHAAHGGDPSFKLHHRGVFSIDVIAHRSVCHGLTHGWCGLRDRVAAKIDAVVGPVAHDGPTQVFAMNGAAATTPCPTRKGRVHGPAQLASPLDGSASSRPCSKRSVQTCARCQPRSEDGERENRSAGRPCEHHSDDEHPGRRPRAFGCVVGFGPTQGLCQGRRCRPLAAPPRPSGAGRAPNLRGQGRRPHANPERFLDRGRDWSSRKLEDRSPHGGFETPLTEGQPCQNREDSQGRPKAIPISVNTT